MIAVVTGATGFIGTALVRQLVKEKHNIKVIVRDGSKVDVEVKCAVEIFHADISDWMSVENISSIMRNADVVFHVAGCINYNAGKERLFCVNAKGTLHMLKLAEMLGVKRFVYISSIEAMGPQRKSEILANEFSSCMPVTLYGESKLEGEKHVIEFANEKRIETVILRLGNVYGPGSLSFVGHVSKAVLHKNKSYLYLNQGRYNWHPVYIDDAVDGIIRGACSERRDEVYILVGTEISTVGELAGFIACELEVDLAEIRTGGIKKMYLNLRKTFSRICSYLKGDRKKEKLWVYSIEKAKRELNYSPKVNLKTGIAKTVEWAKDNGLLEV